MVEDALASNKMIGMIQTKGSNNSNKPEVFSVGCLGKIDTHTKTADGRYLINLKGLVRFRILDEAETELPYRKFRVSYDEFLEKDIFLDNNINNIINSEIYKYMISNHYKFVNWINSDLVFLREDYYYSK